MGSLHLPDTYHRRLFSLDLPAELSLVRWSRAMLIIAVVMLTLAPLVVADSYSVIENTLSESGGQGVEGAWFMRTAVLLTGFTVLMMSAMAESAWGRTARWSIRTYALALVMLVFFSEAPWDGSAHNEPVAFMHTVFAVVGAAAFILGVHAVSRARTNPSRWDLLLDWAVIAAIALVPQVMMVVQFDGLLQRFMVGLGYAWLVAESTRIADRAAQTTATL